MSIAIASSLRLATPSVSTSPKVQRRMRIPQTPPDPPIPKPTDFLENAMERYGKATYNFAYRLTGNEADARDLTQEAFIHAYRARLAFESKTPVLSWLYRIVTLLHRNQLRKQKGRFQDGCGPSAPGGPLAKALSQLPSDQRQAIVLADIEDYSYQDIADIMGCSTETVRSLVRRARALLRRLVVRAPQPAASTEQP